MQQFLFVLIACFALMSTSTTGITLTHERQLVVAVNSSNFTSSVATSNQDSTPSYYF